MLEIWGRPNSNNVMSVMWAVGELGIDYQRHNVGGSFGGLDTEAFLAMNPNGRIPVINHDGRILYESTTVVRYLAGIFDQGSLLPADHYQRAIAEQWMDWFKSTFYPAFFPVFWGLIRTPQEQRDLQSIEQAVKNTIAVLNVAEQRLQEFPYLGGDTFSVADIPLGACIYRYFNLEIDRPTLPALGAWFDRLSERPPYREHVMIPFGRNHTEWLQLEAGFADQADQNDQDG